MDVNLLTKLYLTDGLSLRHICRELGVSESNKNRFATMLRANGVNIRRSKEGVKSSNNAIVACPKCNEKRKIILKKMNVVEKVCRKCATIQSHKDSPRGNSAENHYNWKGGLRQYNGYSLVYLKKDNKYFAMTGQKVGNRGGYVLEHRLVMAKHLGRLLLKEEIVHHVNGDKLDNRIENLNIINKKEHKTTYQDGFRDGYKRACENLKNKTWNGSDWE